MAGLLPEFVIQPAKEFNAVMAPAPAKVMSDFSQRFNAFGKSGNHTKGLYRFHGNTLSE